MELLCSSPESLNHTASQLLEYLNDEVRIVLFKGELGSGKTSLVKEICIALGCEENVTSPTFSLINEYRVGEQPFYHIDLYRLDTTEEAVHIGIEDYLSSGNWCFIEWPELIRPLVHIPYAEVDIEIQGMTTRKFRILKYTTEPRL